jgi:hypothetical protein
MRAVLRISSDAQEAAAFAGEAFVNFLSSQW